MRKHGKIDANQPLIVATLRKAGATVKSLASLGDGAPDLLVGFRQKNWIVEVKDPSQPPSKRRLTIDEKAFHLSWQGQVCVIETPEEALGLIGL